MNPIEHVAQRLRDQAARIAELKATILFERQANERNCAELLAAKVRLAAVIALCDAPAKMFQGPTLTREEVRATAMGAP